MTEHPLRLFIGNWILGELFWDKQYSSVTCIHTHTFTCQSSQFPSGRLKAGSETFSRIIAAVIWCANKLSANNMPVKIFQYHITQFTGHWDSSARGLGTELRGLQRVGQDSSGRAHLHIISKKQTTAGTESRCQVQCPGDREQDRLSLAHPRCVVFENTWHSLITHTACVLSNVPCSPLWTCSAFCELRTKLSSVQLLLSKAFFPDTHFLA